MKRLLLLSLLATATLRAQVAAPPAYISNWPTANTVLTLTDPNTTNQVVGWNDTTNSFVWVTAGGGTGIGSDTFWAAKGDLAVGTADNAASVLGVGSNGQVLTADSTVSPTGLKWATPSGGVTVPLVLTLDNNLAVANDALSLVNSIAATTTNRFQYSPDLRWQGSGWKTGGTPGPQAIEWRAYTLSATDAAATENYWNLDSRTTNGTTPSGSWVNRLQIWDGEPGAFGTWVFANSLAITGTAGKGRLELNTQSADDTTTPATNKIHLYSDSVGRLVWKHSDGFNRRFASTLTADRIYTWPDAAGNVVLDSATQTLTNKSIVATQIDSGTVDPARLGSGTSITTKFLRGDSTWQTVSGIAADTFWAAKGDMAVATANDAASVLTVGANNTVLTADSAQATGVKWATPAGGGNVSNSGTPTTGALTKWASSTTLVNADLSGDITTSGGTSTSIAAGAVTLADMANVATGTVFYRKTAGTGAPEVQTLATLKTDLATGTVTNSVNLANNAVVLGDGGTAGVKTSAGITTNGGSILTLAGNTTQGKIQIFNLSNWDTNIIASTTNTSTLTMTLPSTTTTIVGNDTTDTLSNKTINFPIIASTGARFRNSANADITLLRAGASGTGFTVTLPEATTTLLGQSDLGTNVLTFLGTPSSANLASAVTGETGSGALVFGTSPDFTTGITIGGVAVPTISSTSTLTNKRINPRVDSSTSASATTWAPNSDTTDIFELAGTLTVAVTTISNPSGTPVDGQKLTMRIKSDATPRALTWSGSQWRASSDLALPSPTVASKTMYLLFIYNSTDTKWDLIAYMTNF